MLEKVTPIILTYNEAPNINRTLAELTWARKILVIDSYSTDNTLDMVKKYHVTFDDKFSTVPYLTSTAPPLF